MYYVERPIGVDKPDVLRRVLAYQDLLSQNLLSKDVPDQLDLINVEENWINHFRYGLQAIKYMSDIWIFSLPVTT